MKILFIADIHIKLGQRNVPTQWAKARYLALWDAVLNLAIQHSADQIMLGGDIFDDIPSMKELEVYFEMLAHLRNFPVILYPGNHEATSKHGTFLTYLENATKMCHPASEIVTQYTQYNNYAILPYTDLHKKSWHGSTGSLLFTHVRGEIPPHVKPEVDLSLFKGWDLVVAGDLHAHSNSQSNILYPGSPVTVSFHRNRSKGENGCLIIDTETLSTEFISLDHLPQLIRKTVDSPEAMLPTDYDHTVYELTGDSKDLSTVQDSDLLDKKISNRNVEARLDFSELETIEDELVLYLLEVEKITDPSDYVSTFRDYVNTTEA